MRLLWITDNHPPERGGASESSARITRGLVRRECMVDLVRAAEGGNAIREETWEGGSLFALPREGLAHFARIILPRLKAMNEKRKFDAVLAFGGPFSLILGPLYSRWLDCPLVSFFPAESFDSLIFDALGSDLADAAIRRSKAVIVQTLELEARIRALYRRSEVHSVTPGLEAEAWQVTPHDRKQARRRRLQLAPEGKTFMLMASAEKPRKGADFLLDALSGCGRAGPLHLHFLGGVPDGLRERLASEQSPSSSSEPFGEHAAVMNALLMADVVALPSLYDGMPLFLLEAMAMGCLVLASDAGGMPEVMKNGENGLVFRAGDIGDCQGRLAELMAMDARRQGEMRRVAAQSVRDHYGAKRECRQVMKILEEIISGRRRPGEGRRGEE